MMMDLRQEEMGSPLRSYIDSYNKIDVQLMNRK